MLLRRLLQKRTDITMNREKTNTTRHPSRAKMAYRMISESCVVPWSRGGTVVESNSMSVSVIVSVGSEGLDVGDTLTVVVVAKWVAVCTVGKLGREMVEAYVCFIVKDWFEVINTFMVVVAQGRLL